MIFRLYARNCCFQGVVLNLKFTLINRLSSMFDQLPLYTFFFNSYRNSRVLAVRNIDLHSARILFYFSIFFYFFCNKQFTNYSKWLIRYSIYIYIYICHDTTRDDVLEIQAANSYRPSLTLIFRSIVIRLRPSLKEYYACCKITGITRNADNERISVCHARSFVRWQSRTGNKR